MPQDPAETIRIQEESSGLDISRREAGVNRFIERMKTSGSPASNVELELPTGPAFSAKQQEVARRGLGEFRKTLQTPVSAPSFAEQTLKERGRNIEQSGYVLGTIQNALDGFGNMVRDLGPALTTVARAGVNLVTDPVGSADWMFNRGGLKALWDGTWDHLKTQYGRNPLEWIAYYPAETLLDVAAVLSGAGATLRTAARAGGFEKIISRISSAVDSAKALNELTASERTIYNMGRLAETLEKGLWSTASGAWDLAGEAVQKIPPLAAIQRNTGLLPSRRINRLTQEKLAWATRRIFYRVGEAYESALRELKGVPDANRAEWTEKMMQAYTGLRPESELSKAEKAYLNRLREYQQEVSNELLKVGDIDVAAWAARSYDVVLGNSGQYSLELRKLLSGKFGISSEDLAKGGLTKVPRNRQLEIAAFLDEELAKTGRKAGYWELVHDAPDAAIETIWGKGSRKNLSVAYTKGRKSARSNIPDSFHDAFFKTYASRVKSVEYQKVLAELIESPETSKYFRRIQHPNQRQIGEGIMPGGYLMGLLKDQGEFAGRLANQLKGSFQDQFNPTSLKKAISAAAEDMFSGDPRVLEAFQGALSEKFGKTIYAVPYDVAHTIGSFLFPYRSEFVSFADKFNGLWKLSLLAANPFWYLQTLISGVLWDWFASPGAVPGVFRKPKFMLKQGGGLPVELNSRLDQVFDRRTLQKIIPSVWSKIFEFPFNPFGVMQRAAQFNQALENSFRKVAFMQSFLKEAKERNIQIARQLGIAENAIESLEDAEKILLRAQEAFEDRRLAWIKIQQARNRMDFMLNDMAKAEKKVTARSVAAVKAESKDAELARSMNSAAAEMIRIQNKIPMVRLTTDTKGVLRAVPSSQRQLESSVRGVFVKSALEEAFIARGYKLGFDFRISREFVEYIDDVARSGWKWNNRLDDFLAESLVRPRRTSGSRVGEKTPERMLKEKNFRKYFEEFRDRFKTMMESWDSFAVGVLGTDATLFSKLSEQYNAAFKGLAARRGKVDAKRKSLLEARETLAEHAARLDGANAALERAYTTGRDNPLAVAYSNAFKAVDEFFFNYYDMHPFQRNVVRNFIFPFWSWYGKIIELAFKLPLKHPMKTSLLFHASRMAADAGNDPDAPEWMRNYVPIGPFPGTTEYLFMNVSGLDPRASVSSTEAGWQARLHPFLVAGLEVVSGREQMTRKPLRGGTVFLGNGKAYNFDPTTNNLTEDRSYIANLPAAGEKLLRMFPPYHLMYETLLRDKTRTEERLDHAAMMNSLSVMSGLINVRLTTESALESRRHMQAYLRRALYYRAAEAMKEAKGHSNSFPYEGYRESFEKMIRAIQAGSKVQ